MGRKLRIEVPGDKLADFCRKNNVRKLAFFGSVLRDDFKPTSDVDVLIEFLPGMPMGFMGMARLELELSDILGRKVDLRTPAELSRYFREEVINGAEVQYAQG
jgi:uncharacterized protein